MIDDIERLISTSTASDVLAALAPIGEKERRSHAGPVNALFRQWYGYNLGYSFSKSEPALNDADAVKVAMLATATRAELKQYRFHVIPRSPPIVEVMGALAPSWIDGWVEDLVEGNPPSACDVAPLWRSGLCRRPESDALILAYYNTFRRPGFTDHPEVWDEHVWRFFEVEGGGELSLATHDKYCKQPKTWSDALLEQAEAGRLDRSRLLDASLDALERDFGQFRAGWYSRFHSALEPSLEEQAARVDRYLRLLASAVPPTVSLAVKTLKALDKAGKVPVDDLLASVTPALLARQKSASTAALQLLAAAAKRAPARAPEIAGTGLSALVSEAPEVQGLALDLVERVGATGLPVVQAALAEHREVVAPSVRARLAGMARDPVRATAAEPRDEAGEADAASFRPIFPAASLDEALAAFLEVLEDPRDPLAVERAMDGVSRFGATCSPGSTELSPLAKRARQIFGTAGYQKVKMALAACGRAWCGEGMPGELVRSALADFGVAGISGEILAATFLERCDEVMARVRLGQALPLLSLPSDTSGQVAPGDLVDRLEQYRAAGTVPGSVDAALALTRLGREGRALHRGRVDVSDDIGKAIAFALGAGTAASDQSPVWAAAWLARSAEEEKPETLWPFADREPDAGASPEYRLIVERDEAGGYPWCRPGVLTVPELRRPDRRMPASLLHHRSRRGWGVSVLGCSHVPADIAWASLVRPGDPEAFLANAISSLDSTERVSDPPCLAYLDAFDRLIGEPGPIARATLAYYLAAEDKAVCAMAVDKLTRLAGERRIPAARFATAILPFMLVGVFPSMRWTRGLAAVAATGPSYRAFVRDVLAGLMRFYSAQAPRDIGGMLELLYELQVDCRTPFDDGPAIACLESADLGGKAAKFSKKLLALQGG
ncbi:MAG TPA: DUF6493 family protein [Allosphingosinicella sp.]|nr:DUF6493 family protein [Allosphingosinicella sp.]